MSDFVNTAEAALRRVFRQAVKRSSMTRTEKEITMVILNLWLYYRHSTGFIHPSKALIARRAKCSRASVKRCLQTLKTVGVLIVIRHAKGGKRLAPHYLMDMSQLAEFCGAGIPAEFEGILAEFDDAIAAFRAAGKGLKTAPSKGSKNLENEPLYGAKNEPLYKGRSDGRFLKTNDPDISDDCSSQSVLWMDGKDYGNA